jgi:hypothetical protein
MNQALSMRALTLQSQSRIEAEAMTLYHMQPVREPQVQWVPIAILHSVNDPALAAAGPRGQALAGRGTASPAARAAATAHRSLLTSWWQAASHALAALFR